MSKTGDGVMTDENEDIAMAECGSCRAVVPIDSENCPECGISFSGVSEDALGECGACSALVPLDSPKCPECGVVFVADDVIDILRTWMATNSMDVKTLFGRFDTNGDGRIDSDELKSGLLSLNLADLPPSQVDKLVQAIDEDGDSLVDLDELQSIIGGEDLPVDDVSEESEDLAMDNSHDDDTDEDESEDEEVEDESEVDEVEEELEEDDTEESEEDDTEEAEEDDTEEADEVDTNQEPKPEEVFRSLGEAIAAQGMTIREVFEAMDADLDGRISGPELQKGIEEFLGNRMTPVATVAVLDLLDSDSDGNIDPMELIQEIESLDLGIETDRKTTATNDLIDGESNTKPVSEIIEELLEAIDEQNLTLSNAFGNMDEDGDRTVTRAELGSKLTNFLDYELSESELDALMDSMDENSDGNIDMIEFVTSIENHEDSIASIDDEEAETVKTFPTKWHSRFMSKRWHDVFWPLIHTGFVILIIAALANGLFPFVDGEGGPVGLETEAGDGWMNADGIVIDEGQAYPCNPTVQVGECKNSLTPLAGESSSMPGGFYLDGIFLMGLSTIGLIGSLYTHLVLAPSWRARVKAMKEVSDDKADVQESLEDDDEIEDTEDTEDDIEEDSEGDESETQKSEGEETDEVLDEDEASPENEELDVGSYVGVDIDGEEYYGKIVEFDDDEDTVTIEEEESGDEITAYQDEMFVPED